MLQAEELQRYSRHLSLSEVGQIGQAKLKAAKVLIIGAGGLGCPVLQYLAAAGIGKIGIVDGDKIDLTNLQRQILYTTADIGKPKVEIAAAKLQEMNPHITLKSYFEHLSKENALNILVEYDLVVDCTDNFPTRYLINDACVILNKPLIFGAIFKFEGQVSVFNLPNSEGEKGATYRCLFPNPPKKDEVPNCAETGVIGVLPGIIGTLQANEVIKIILGIGEPLRNKILMLDALTLQTQIIRFKRVETQANITELTDYEEVCEVKIEQTKMKTISASEFKQQMDNQIDWQIIDVREDYEYEICHIENAQLMPMSEIEKFIPQIDRQKPVLLYCHRGARSAKVIEYLEKKHHFSNLHNLIGGIHTWAVEIDTEMAVY